MVALGLYGVTKEFKDYNCRNRWLRRELIEMLSRSKKRQDTRTVLQDVSFEVAAGETVAVMGRNGSGKSTLLKIMAGILQPTKGHVVRRGVICTLFDIGTGFHEDQTGRENVLVNGAILGLSEGFIRSALPEIESFAELEGFMDTPLRFYSSGMRARLGFAVAMSADPDVFLIDEVLAVGDEGFRRKCCEKLDELMSRGRTIIIVSHDVDTVRRLCHRGIWIHEGRMRADGPVDDVAEEYLEFFGDAGLTATARGG